MKKQYNLSNNVLNVMFFLKKKRSNNTGLKLKQLEEIMGNLNYCLNTETSEEIIISLNLLLKVDRYEKGDLIYLSNFYNNVYIDLFENLDSNTKSKVFYDLIIKSYKYNTLLDGIINNNKYKQTYLTILHKYKYLVKSRIADPKYKLYDIIQKEFNKRV